PAFDCFLFPSVFEGFGIAALEAQSCGVKAYCSDTLSPSLNVTGNVVFLPLGDAKIWADAVTAGNREEPDREAMNRSVRESGHNVNNQIRMLTELLNG
ncbi:MAG: glycosyltransferase, partial [Clostridia bacterium]|nr:glycosyltransferase [Clostridia bacterium]